MEGKGRRGLQSAWQSSKQLMLRDVGVVVGVVVAVAFDVETRSLALAGELSWS